MVAVNLPRDLGIQSCLRQYAPLELLSDAERGGIASQLLVLAALKRIELGLLDETQVLGRCLVAYLVWQCKVRRQVQVFISVGARAVSLLDRHEPMREAHLVLHGLPRTC